MSKPSEPSSTEEAEEPTKQVERPEESIDPVQEVKEELTEPRTFDLMSEIGGPQGVADSSFPAIVFVAVYTFTGNRLELAAGSAVAAALVIALARLWRGESLRFALAGFVGVAIAGFIATRTGRAEDFFLPGLLINAAYAAAYLVSIAIRWPLIGVLLGPLTGNGMSWRREPGKVRTYSAASWVWVGVFTARLAVQLPFYLAGSVVALGVARTAMGVPVFALGAWLTWLILRRGGLDPLAGRDRKGRLVQ